MPTDIELHIERHTTYKHLTTAEASRQLAFGYGLDEASLRSRLSRATRNPKAAKALQENLAQVVATLPLSVERQLELMEISKTAYGLQLYHEDRIGVFVSDLHMPLHRLDAYELLMTILHDIKPNLISALNDEMDNGGYGKHEDTSPVYQKLWRSDFQQARNMQHAYHNDLKSSLKKGGMLVGLMGNHDRWIFNHWRSKVPQTAEKLIADYMEDLVFEDDVLMFSRGIKENSLWLSKGLVWTHGLSAAANPMTIARKAFSTYMRDGRACSVVQGHTHRPAVVDGSIVKYRGVKFVNSGHLRHDNPDWLVHKPEQWGMGIVICNYNPMIWEHEIDLVLFQEKGNKLVAEYKGKKWEVPLDKDPLLHLS